MGEAGILSHKGGPARQPKGRVSRAGPNLHDSERAGWVGPGQSCSETRVRVNRAASDLHLDHRAGSTGSAQSLATAKRLGQVNPARSLLRGD